MESRNGWLESNWDRKVAEVDSLKKNAKRELWEKVALGAASANITGHDPAGIANRVVAEWENNFFPPAEPSDAV